MPRIPRSIDWDQIREEIRGPIFDSLPDSLNDFEANALAGVMADFAVEHGKLLVYQWEKQGANLEQRHDQLEPG
jgi:hypothetical protein